MTKKARNVRYGSKADIGSVSVDVRYPPKADISVVLLQTLHDVVGDEMTLVRGKSALRM
jgi:hypothetical protein